MSKHVIRAYLGKDGITHIINQLKAYKRQLPEMENRLLLALAEKGFHEASVRFSTAIYDGINDSKVDIEPIDNGYAIVARGNAVAFIEFGTGVTHNTGEPYPLPRPDGIVGIGEYGEGKGKRKAWGYTGDPGTNGELKSNGIVITRGNPAAMPMWYAAEEIRNSISRIVKEVFE